jgi:hypothetical protein
MTLMNNEPRSLEEMLQYELSDAEKQLKWGDLDADGKVRMGGFIDGIRIGLSALSDLRRLAGMADGLARATMIAAMASQSHIVKED